MKHALCVFVLLAPLGCGGTTAGVVVEKTPCSASVSEQPVVESQKKAAEDASPEGVIFVNASSLNDPLSKRFASVELPPLTTGEEERVREELRQFPSFPGNAFSGCHARAHVAYGRLDAVAKGKIFKVWLLSGSLLSPAFSGAIQYAAKTGRTTSWDYHVAAAFRTTTSSEPVVVDTLVSPEPLPLRSWIRLFHVDGFAVATVLPGHFYLFNRTDEPAADPKQYPDGQRIGFMARNVLNGSFYDYSGASAEGHWGASDLAADAVSTALLEGRFPGCDLNASQSLQIKKSLQGSTVSSQCAPAKDLFMTEFTQWQKAGL